MATKPIEQQVYKNNAERLAAIKRLARSTNNKQGISGITMASDIAPSKRLSFGIKELDDATGGGLLHGCFSILWGEPGCSKTTMAMMIAAQAQKEGKLVCWAALEKFDPIRAKEFGVNLDEMPVLTFPKAEQVLDVLLQYAREKLVDVFILDSIHSLSPKGVQEDSKGQKSMEDSTIGVLARKLSEFFPQAKDPVERADMAVVLIGQTRVKIGFICIEALTGGNALHHAAKFIMRIRHGAKDDAPFKDVTVDGKKEKKQIGFNAVFKFDKVQVSGCKPEQTSFSLPFFYESGYNLPSDLKEQVAKEEAEIEAQNAPVATKVEETAPTAVEPEKVVISPSGPYTASVNKEVKRRGRPKKTEK